MPILGYAYSPVSADTLLTSEPAFLGGLVVLASVDGGDVTLYDGLDAGSGRLIGRFEGLANVSNPIIFPDAVPLDRGLFVDVGSNITEVLLLWRPLSDVEARVVRQPS